MMSRQMVLLLRALVAALIVSQCYVRASANNFEMEASAVATKSGDRRMQDDALAADTGDAPEGSPEQDAAAAPEGSPKEADSDGLGGVAAEVPGNAVPAAGAQANTTVTDGDVQEGSPKGATQTKTAAAPADPTPVLPASSSASEAELASLRAEVAAQKQTILSLQGEVQAKSAESQKLGEEKQKLGEEKQKLGEEAASERQKVSDYSADLQLKSEQISKLSSVKTMLEESIAAKDAQVSNLTNQLDALARQKADVQRQAENYLQQVSHAESENSRLERNEVELRKRVSEGELVRKELAKAKNNLETELGERKVMYNSLYDQYSDPSVQHFLEAKAIKMYEHPGISGAANKTFVFVLPSLRKRYSEGEELIDKSKALVYTKLNAFVGTEKVEPWLPLMSGILVYGSFIVPFLCAVCCLTRIMCRRRVCLLFCHLYFLLVCLCATGFAVSVGRDPLTAFAHHDAAVYLFAQVMVAVMLVLYSALLIVSWFFCPGSGANERCYRLLQVAGVGPMVIAYYFWVWTPAVLDQMPKLDEMVFSVAGHARWASFVWVPYVPPSVVFLLALGLELLALRAYNAKVRSKHEMEQISVGMRDVSGVTELASLIGKEQDLEAGPKSA